MAEGRLRHDGRQRVEQLALDRPGETTEHHRALLQRQVTRRFVEQFKPHRGR